MDMQSLVQRQKGSSVRLCSQLMSCLCDVCVQFVESPAVLSVVERQLLWVLEMYAFAEAVRCSRLQHQQHVESQATGGDSLASGVDSAQGAEGCGEGEGREQREERSCAQYANHPPALRCLERALKVCHLAGGALVTIAYMCKCCPHLPMKLRH